MTKRLPMIDKLTFSIKEFDLKGFIQSQNNIDTYQRLHNNYLNCTQITDRGNKVNKFVIYSKPRMSNLDDFKIELNPSKLGMGFNQLCDFFGSFMDLDKTKIRRIDHAVDMQMSVEDAFTTIRFKGKQQSKKYDNFRSGNMEGFYLGGSFESLVVYDKCFERRGKRLVKISKPDQPYGMLTRFELRQSKTCKRMVCSLKEISGLLNFKPFENIEAIDKDGAIELFGEEVRHLGFHRLYSKRNSQNNFKRDYSEKIPKSNLINRLNEVYGENLSQFIHGGLDENA
jgi:hypothetical protein